MNDEWVLGIQLGSMFLDQPLCGLESAWASCQVQREERDNALAELEATKAALKFTPGWL